MNLPIITFDSGVSMGVIALQDGVYMDEVVEIAVGAMHFMAKDVSSRLKMKQLNCIPIFVQVLCELRTNCQLRVEHPFCIYIFSYSIHQ